MFPSKKLRIPLWCRVCIWTVALRALVGLVALLIVSPNESKQTPPDGVLIWPTSDEMSVSSKAGAWDSAHYLRIAHYGYVKGDASCAFYPLWPYFLKWVNLAFKSSNISAVWIGIVIANALIFCVYYLLAQLFQGHGQASPECSAALVLFPSTPGAMFLSVGYSEALSLFLAAFFFLGLRDEKWACITIAGFLLPLSRAVGVFCLAPLIWRAFQRHTDWRAWAVCFAPLTGYATYFFLMWHWTGNPFEGFAAQKHYPNQPSLANIVNLSQFFQSLCNIGSILGMLDGGLDRLLFVLLMLTLPALWRVNKEWFWWTVCVGIIPAMSNWFFSYRRFLVMAFPVFYIWGQWLSPPGKLWMFRYYVTLSAIVQGLLVWRYVNFLWAG